MTAWPDVRFGCQTYTWEMNGAGSETPEAMVAAIADAGYAGVEFTEAMIGRYLDAPSDFARLLERHGLAFVAYTVSSATGYTVATARQQDLEATDRAIGFVANFPGAWLTLGSATAFGSTPLDDMFATAAAIYNEAGRRASTAGVTLGIHASSHEDTLLTSEADYARILAMTDGENVGWVPDTGHMLRCGHDLMSVLERHTSRINYLHIKDVDDAGEWVMLGQGRTDLRALAGFAAATRPGGWIIMEEESQQATRDPAAAIAANFSTLSHLMSA